MIDIHDLLRTARKKFGMDAAFIGQFDGDRRLFRVVDAVEGSRLVQGRTETLDGSYCKLVAEGRLAGLIPDTSQDVLARDLAVSRAVPVGAHLSVPIRDAEGRIWGTLCFFAHEPRPALNGRDLAALEMLAEIVGVWVERDAVHNAGRATVEQRIQSVMAAGGPVPVYQPVFMIDDLRIAGAEALSRFPSSDRPVDLWFREAAEVGVQVEFELLAIRNALRGYKQVWEQRRIQLGLNASTATIVDPRLWVELDGYPLDLLVIELTEHEQVRDYGALLQATARLRARGTKIAIDDVGAGYASMRHVLTMRPDILKLDVGLIRSIDADDLRSALTSSLKHFADQFSCRVVAEGVETEEELSTLRRLSLQAAQGYLLGRPAGADVLLGRLRAA